MKKNSKLAIAKEYTFPGKIFRLLAFLIIEPAIRLLWLKEVKGRENLPAKGAYILAANHQSYFDWLVLYSIMPRRLSFLAAEKLFASKFWRPFMEYTGQIKVDRAAEDKSIPLDLGKKILNEGEILAIFPQGTRSRSGEIEKTYTGVARLALEAQVPVIPVGIKGAYEVMAPHDKRPKFKKIIQIYFGQPIYLNEYYAQEKTPILYRELTDRIMKKIAQLSDKQYNP